MKMQPRFGGVHYERLEVTSMLIADDAVLLAPSKEDL